MIDMGKITDVLDSDEGTSLLAEYTKLFLQANYPENTSDENHQKMVMLLVIKQISEQTVPYGMDCKDYIIKFLKASIDNLKENTNSSAAKPSYTSAKPSYTSAKPSYTSAKPAHASSKRRSKPLIIAGVVTILASELLMANVNIGTGIVALVVGIIMLVNGLIKKDRL